MFSIFWKSLFSSLMIFFIFSNIAFAFNMIGLVNATPVPLMTGDEWSNYYFGVSSFIDSFKTWFGNNSALSGFSAAISKIGGFIGKTMNMLPTRMIGSISSTGGIIALVVNIIMWTNSVLPFIFGAFYVIMLALYYLFLAFQIIAYIVYWFGGGFMTPLPSTDWFEYTGQWDWTPTLRAMMV